MKLRPRKGSEEYEEHGKLVFGLGFRRENEAGAIASSSAHRCGRGDD